MNPNTMTAQECADWCAKDDGWIEDADLEYDDLDGYPHIGYRRKHADGIRSEKRWDHPHPLTLDGAAKALPEGWSWTKHATSFGKWWAAYPPGWNGEEYPEVVDTGDEIADRYRLAVACRMAAKEQA